MSLRKVKLGKLCTITKGIVGIQKAIPGEYPMVVTGEERKTHNEYQFDEEAVIIPLVSGTGHGHASIKRIHYQTGKFALGSILCAVIPKDKTILNTEYLYRFLDLNKENELVARMKGMANVTLPIKEIAQIEIPLPSILDQKKFVENYKKLEETKEKLSLELTHQLTLVKQLRQQLLQDAVQGKLVAQHPADEPGSELLMRIKAEKEQLVAEKKLKKEKELPPIKEEEIPFNIPESWVWCRLGEISPMITDGTHKTPNYTKEGIPFISAQNLFFNNIDYNNIKFITPLEYNQYFKNKALTNGDVLLAKSGTLGISAVFEKNETYAFYESIALIRILLETINSYYISNFLNYNSFRYIKENQKGIGVKHLHLVDIRNFLIPLPPISEQNRIVKKLDELMQVCNALEESIGQSAAQNEKLLQQVLREALRKE